MQEVFARIYEWFGLIPFYSKDMRDHLRAGSARQVAPSRSLNERMNIEADVPSG